MVENTSDEDETAGTGEDLQKVTKTEARARLNHLLNKGFTEDSPALIEALPAVGKSYGVVKWAAQTGNPVTVFTERHELYDQYQDWATNEFDLIARQLPVFHNDCPTVRKIEDTTTESGGFSITPITDTTNAEQWRERVLKKYKQGVSGRELHNRASSYFGEELPCQRNGSCPYIESIESDTGDIDILIGNFRQAFAEQYQEDRYVVFDEFPGENFLQQFSSDSVSKTVNSYVSDTQQLPFQNWRDVLVYNRSGGQDSAVTKWLNSRDRDRDTQPLHRRASSGINAYGPLLTEIVLRFDDLDNGWRRADLGEGQVAVQSSADDEISLLDPPPTDEAEGVVAIDGTPCVEMWELLLNEDLSHHSVFTDGQKREYLRDVLQLQLIQTASTTKPYHSGRSVTPDKDIALIEAVGQREGQKPTVISSKAAISEYDERGVEEIAENHEHYNNLKGSGEFGTVRLGMVVGCPQPGDDRIELWSALAGHSVAAKTDENGDRCTGLDLDFGPFGNLVLEALRENEVLQAAMRFGREEEDNEVGATVYIHTAAIPDWVQPEREIPNLHAHSKGEAITQVIKTIKDRDDWQTGQWKNADIEVEGFSPKSISQSLKALSEEGYISSRRGSGRGNPHVWSNERLEEIGTYGFAEW